MLPAKACGTYSAQLAIADDAYDLVLLDLGLPRRSLEVLRKYRASGGITRVLIITARDSTAERVEGLDSGAADYLVKPFDLEELLARDRPGRFARRRTALCKWQFRRPADPARQPARQCIALHPRGRAGRCRGAGRGG